jgi:beta-N-acetylhexosaminidase
MKNLKEKKWIDQLLGKMNLEQKVGQMLVLGFCGPVITPDIVELITKYHIGGLRISQKFRTMTLANDIKPGTEPDPNMLRSLRMPTGKCRDFAYSSQSTFCTAQEYAEILNKLRDFALERQLGIGLHFTIDQEGSACDDLLSNQRLFPHPMGYVAANDIDLAYRSALCIARQAHAVGANMIHSPVLDVNTNSKNPEIGTRAYSNDPAIVAEYALASMRGLHEGGLVATGKHFPGRGESDMDAHWGLPSVTLDLATLHKVHIAPYRALIEAGLPAVMIAHCSYPAINGDKPACVSSEIVTNILRKDMGFDGVITTDNLTMGGILQRYEMAEAAVLAISAGCDLILCRDEGPIRYEIIDKIIKAVKSGYLKESQINESVHRILEMRWNMGLTRNGGKVDAAKAGDLFSDPVVVNTAQEAANKSVLLLRDKAKLLPLQKNTKILLIEQIFPTHAFANNMYSHPGLLWEQMCLHSDNVASIEIPYVPTDADLKRVLKRLPEAQVVVVTNYYYHKAASSISNFVREVKQVIPNSIVVTNTPYEFGAPADFDTVITCFNPGAKEHMQAVAEVIFGKLIPTARMPIKLSRHDDPKTAMKK